MLWLPWILLLSPCFIFMHCMQPFCKLFSLFWYNYKWVSFDIFTMSIFGIMVIIVAKIMFRCTTPLSVTNFCYTSSYWLFSGNDNSLECFSSILVQFKYIIFLLCKCKTTNYLYKHFIHSFFALHVCSTIYVEGDRTTSRGLTLVRVLVHHPHKTYNLLPWGFTSLGFHCQTYFVLVIF